MEGPLAVVVVPTRKDHAGHAHVAAQVLVEAAWAVRTSWPSRQEGRRAEGVRCVVFFEPDDVRLERPEECGGSPLIFVRDRTDGRQMPAGVSDEVQLGRMRLDLARVAALWLTKDALGRAARAFDSHPIMAEHPWVRRALLLALSEKRTNVQGLAARIGCSDRHLQRRWAHMNLELAERGRPLGRFKRFLDTILLLHALIAWLEDPSLRAGWSAIAQGLGVTEQTVRNVMHEVLETEPSAVEISNVVSLILQIESNLLASFG